MSDVASPTPRRRPRADAARNRARLIEAAREVFAEKGSQASLEEIARVAGVGIGTLYRRFPTRDALVAEVYRDASRQLIEAADRIGATQPPVEALRTWLLLFVDHMANKMRMAEALNAMVGGPAALYAASTEETKRAIGDLVGRATAAGAIDCGLEPLDLIRALGGIAYLSPETDWRRSAEALVDVLIAGLARGGGRDAANETIRR
ncbi:MAG: TetR/AcrR family transcriptional regulator; helix-turn-helix transcriptional regulator [Hyphomicrobiales bacterium]|nr:TetR/AcrR family transcriptional regulator; helix-turn-helix transcriptional regulator [Hyphomicrobiales bacterium]